MITKKASVLGFIIIALVLIILISIIIVVISIKNKENNTPKVDIPDLSLFINSADKDFESSSYILMQNNTLFKSGEINGWTEIRADSNHNYQLYCWNKEHYLSYIEKNISQEDIRLNSTRMICNLDKIGNINITHQGMLGQSESSILINISTDYWLKNSIICESHTAGFISINSDNQTSIPSNVKDKIDNCFILGNLFNSSKSILFDIKPFSLIEGDEIIFYVFDFDYRFTDSNFILVQGEQSLNYTISY